VTSTFGVGELIKRVASEGARRVFVTMGDSATMDMGIGMLSALGVRFFDGHVPIEAPGMRDLARVTHFDSSPLTSLGDISITGLVDTKDFLCGTWGQAEVYGRQKGILKKDIHAADAALRNFAEVIGRQLGIDVTRLSMGTGSGGLGASLHAFFHAPLLHTPEYFWNRIDLDAVISSADLVITGEGRLDGQTRWGKVPHFIASRSAGPCVAIVGSYTETGRSDLEEASSHDVCVLTMNRATSNLSPGETLAAIVRDVGVLLRSWDWDGRIAWDKLASSF
jgi:glycerate kinase